MTVKFISMFEYDVQHDQVFFALSTISESFTSDGILLYTGVFCTKLLCALNFGIKVLVF